MEKVDYPGTRIEQENKAGQDNKVIGAKTFAVQEKLSLQEGIFSMRRNRFAGRIAAAVLS